MVFKQWKMRYVPTCVSSDCTVLQQHYDEKNNIKVVETKKPLLHLFERGEDIAVITKGKKLFL